MNTAVGLHLRPGATGSLEGTLEQSLGAGCRSERFCFAETVIEW